MNCGDRESFKRSISARSSHMDTPSGVSLLPKVSRYGRPLHRLWRYVLLTSDVAAVIWFVALHAFSWHPATVWSGSYSVCVVYDAPILPKADPWVGMGGLLVGAWLGMGLSWLYARYLEG